MLQMYAGSDVRCAVKVIELEDDYRVQITGAKVKKHLSQRV